MTDQKQFKALLKRDMLLNSLFLLAVLTPHILLVFYYVEEYQSYMNNYENVYLPSFLNDITYSIFAIFLLILFRWFYCESPKYRLTNATLPISKENWLRYDLFTGYVAILLFNIGDFLVETWHDLILWDKHNYVDGYRVYFDPSLVEYVLEGTLVLFVIYTLFVIGKQVSANVGWSILVYVIILFFLYIITKTWYKISSEIYNYFIYAPRHLLDYAIDIFFVILLVLLWKIAHYLVAKKDEAKYGAYYFTWVQLIVCLMPSLFTFFFCLEKKRAGIKPITLYVHNIFLFIASVGVFVGLFYITSPKNKLMTKLGGIQLWKTKSK